MRPEAISGMEPGLVRLLLPEAEGRFPEQVMALAWWPEDRRAAALSVLALGAELTSIPEKVSDPTLGAVRLAFWREVAGEVASGHARAHPVAQGLLAQRAAFGDGVEALLGGLIDAATAALPAEGEGASGDAGPLQGALLGLLGGIAGAEPEEGVKLETLGVAMTAEDAVWEGAFASLVPFNPKLSPIIGAARLARQRGAGRRKSAAGQRFSLFLTVLRGR